MLSSPNRLTASSDIERVVVKGARVRTNIITIYSAPSDKGRIRLACVAGKKVHPSAVIRHSIQRKLRAACRLHITSLSGSYDIVVVALNQEIRVMSVDEVVRDIARGLEKMGIKQRQ